MSCHPFREGSFRVAFYTFFRNDKIVDITGTAIIAPRGPRNALPKMIDRITAIGGSPVTLFMTNGVKKCPSSCWRIICEAKISEPTCQETVAAKSVVGIIARIGPINGIRFNAPDNTPRSNAYGTDSIAIMI